MTTLKVFFPQKKFRKIFFLYIGYNEYNKLQQIYRTLSFASKIGFVWS
jgi:hypothetical protein